MPKKTQLTESSGNVFQDLGFKDHELRIAKAELAARIADLIVSNKYTQQEAAKILKIRQPKVCALMSGKLEGFSIERLLKFLIRLDQDVKIIVRPKPKRRKKAAGLLVALT